MKRRWSTIVVAVSALASGALLGARAGGQPPAPGGIDVDAAVAMVRRNEACARCHEREAREVEPSLHRRSHDDETYLASLAGEPSAFCERCHAPLAAAPGGAALGIGCTGCHVDDGHERAPERPLAKVRCEPCHEFRFPQGSELMQRTVSEHRASRHASVSCVECHMPVVGAGAARHRAHGTPASRDEAVLRRAISADARLVGPGSLEVGVSVRAAGHAVPTGDMFRRLVVRAEASDREGRIIGRAEKVLARRFVLGPHGPTEVGDDRPGPSGARTTVGLDLGEVGADSRIRWRVDYERVVNGLRAPLTIAATVSVASGELR